MKLFNQNHNKIIHSSKCGLLTHKENILINCRIWGAHNGCYEKFCILRYNTV
jgi:hypothetical protein